jgi:hypothetical protein
MNFYFSKENEIRTTEADLSAEIDFLPLTQEQINFYMSHPNCSVDEVRTCHEIVINLPSLEFVKDLKIRRIEDLYTNLLNSTFNVATSICIGSAFFSDNLMPKNDKQVLWIVMMSLEKTRKKNEVMALTTVEEVSNYDITPSYELPPYTTDVVRDEFIDVVKVRLAERFNMPIETLLNLSIEEIINL